MSNYQIPMKGEEITSRLQSIGTKSDTAAEDTAFGRIAKNTESINALARRYDYVKINGLTTSSTSEQVKAALTPIDGTEVVFPTKGNTITNGTGISIDILATTSNTFSYIHNNQLVTLGFSLAEGREAVTSKVQTSLLKPMYDFAKINALTGESGNDEIEAAIKQLQTSTTTAPSAGALLVDASTLAPLAVVTESSSNAPTMTEVFSYTHGGVKYTVEISGEQGALMAKVSTQAVMQRRYDLNKLNHLTEESSDADIRDALTPIGEAEMTVPKIGDVITMDKQGSSLSSIFLEVVESPTQIGLTYECNGIIVFLRIDKGDEYSAKVDKYDFGLFNKTLSTLQTTVTQQGTQIQSNTKNINGLHEMDVISDSVQVVFKQYMSRETGKEEKEFMIQAPKGMLSGEEKVKLYRKLATRYKVKDDIFPYEHRVKSGWINYSQKVSANISENLYELEAVPFESSKPSYEYDFFRIVRIEKNYRETFDEILRSKCTLEMDEDTGTWKHVIIRNGRKAKKLLNYSNDLGFKIPVSFITWGVQLATNQGEAYTPIMPFKVRYQMGNPAHQGKFTEKEAAEFTLDDLYISMSK